MPPVSRLFPLLHVLISCALSMMVPAVTAASNDDPETVIVTYRVKPNEEAALTRVITKHWNVARRLNLVQSSPHILLQGKDQGTPFIMEIFTWRDSSIPDNAPDEITRIWQEMGQLVEARQGHPGIDFSHVRILRAHSRKLTEHATMAPGVINNPS